MQQPEDDPLGDDGEGETDHLFSRDLMFDSWATLSEDTMERHVGDIVLQFYVALIDARDGKPLRAEVSWGVGEIVPTIIANLMLLLKARPEGARLVLQMEHSAVTRYERHGLRQLPEVVDTMAALGLIIKHRAVFKQRRTAIEAASELKEALLRDALALGDIVRASGEEIIQVTARPAIKRIGGKKLPKVLVDYEDTEQSIGLRRELDDINRFLSSRSITLRGNSMPAFRLVRRFRS